MSEPFHEEMRRRIEDAWNQFEARHPRYSNEELSQMARMALVAREVNDPRWKELIDRLQERTGLLSLDIEIGIQELAR